MPRSTRNLLLAAAAIAGTLVTAFQADASAPGCIRQASEVYRESVRQFEDEVGRSRSGGQANRFEVRRLRQQADRFHHAVRHHNDYFRYASSWQDLSDLHFRVERSFVAGCRQSDPRLFHAWRHVSMQYERLSDVVHFQARAGRGRHGGWDHRGGHDRFGDDRFGHNWNHSDFGGRDQFGRDQFGRDQFGRDQFGRDQFGRDQFGRDQFGRDPFGHDPFGSRHGVARPSFGPSVVPIPAVPPVRGFAPHVDPRREAAAAITGAILQRLLN